MGLWRPKTATAEATAVFEPAALQPTGKAAKEIKALQAWLRRPDVVKALMDEGFLGVNVVRKELLVAAFERTEVLKARVK